MKITFDLVRLGKTRKDRSSELLLRQNVNLLKEGVISLLEEHGAFLEQTKISFVVVIPARGYNIKLILDFVKNEEIKKMIRCNFSNSIYKGDKYKVWGSVSNKVF